MTKTEQLKNAFECTAIHEAAHAVMFFAVGAAASVQLSVYRDGNVFSGDVCAHSNPFSRADDVAISLAGPMSRFMFGAPKNKQSDKLLMRLVLEKDYEKGPKGFPSDLEHVYENFTAKEIEEGCKICSKGLRRHWSVLLRIKREVTKHYSLKLKHVSLRIELGAKGVKFSKAESISPAARSLGFTTKGAK